jgi:photosystem II stability/assembly factor-like uncharacterized protein
MSRVDQMRRTGFLLLGFLLVACLSPEDAPQVTDTPEATVTLSPASPTPELTSTPEPTSTPVVEAISEAMQTVTPWWSNTD